MEVAKDFQRNLPDCPLSHPGKKNLAEFGEQRIGKAQHPVEDQEHDGEGEHLLRAGQAVNHILEDNGDADVGYLRRNQATECGEYAKFVLPEVRQQGAQGQPHMHVSNRLSGWRFGEGGGATHRGSIRYFFRLVLASI